MISFSHTIQDAEGLHARPVTLIAAAAMKFDSDVTVSRGGAVADAKDLMALMALCARCGDVLEVRVAGADEERAAEAMRAAFTF